MSSRWGFVLGILAVGCEGNRNESDVVRAATIRVSLTSDGRDPLGSSRNATVSADGRTVAFDSSASNLVAGDTNGASDVFVREIQSGTTELISVSTVGGVGNGGSTLPALSGDGRYVAFLSTASNLVAGDTNGKKDVFVRDRIGGTTTRASLDSLQDEANGDCEAPSLSSDGRYVVFSSVATDLVSGDGNGKKDIFRRDRDLAITIRVSLDVAGGDPNGDSEDPSVSDDGNTVAFASAAGDLHSDDPNATVDVFARDIAGATTHLISRASASGGVDGALGNAASGSVSAPPVRRVWISGDGRWVAFESGATNLVGGDTNGKVDIFVRDRVLKATERVSVHTDGTQALQDNAGPRISRDGRYVVWTSYAPNLVPSDNNAVHDCFLRDRTLGTTVRVSVRTYGEEGITQGVPVFTAAGTSPAISPDGTYVVFESDATNLVDGDLNGQRDVFLRGPLQ